MFQQFTRAAAGAILFACGLLSITSCFSRRDGGRHDSARRGRHRQVHEGRASRQCQTRGLASCKAVARSHFGRQGHRLSTVHDPALRRRSPSRRSRPDVGDPFVSEVLGLLSNLLVARPDVACRSRRNHGRQLQRGLSTLLREPDVDRRLGRPRRARGPRTASTRLLLAARQHAAATRTDGLAQTGLLAARSSAPGALLPRETRSAG